MSDSPTATRLRQIAYAVRSLPQAFRALAPKDLAESCGSLVKEAIDLGALSAPEHVKLRLLVRRQTETYPDGWRFGVFAEAVTCITPDLEKQRGLIGAAEPACEKIADTIDREADRIAGGLLPDGSTKAKGGKTFVATKLQQDILKALNGAALKKQALADRACGGEGTRLYRIGGIKELTAIGVVDHKDGVGYYRPDAPPDGLIVRER
jgi:hypothetical protein